ncbi:hypothetical protein [Blautia sp. MCC283]|uniref:hypothetical protein n=1 Tax=Blautia sp. MCC283 TaxID=2592640 RepID=UPI001C033840|nr:hypothetical protein [Blautia sp. MCC283]MBT9841493.1 hypothetical protein [Blautia sp. MCC283]
MLDAKNCTEEAYKYAMNKSEADVTTIPTNILYILYTKYKSDAVKLRRTDRCLAADAKKKKTVYWNELARRKTEAW